MIPSSMKKIVTILLLAFSISGFSQVPENWEGKVMTVNGLIPADSMGITLPHEHLLIVHTFDYLNLTNEQDAITELRHYINAGGKTLAEASALGIGRNPEGLKRISTATGANVIMCTGYYKDQWIHDSLKNKSVEQLTDIMINDIKNGINGIHAGFIKIGMSRLFSPFEEKVLIAAAHAQKATGVAIDVHFDGHRATIKDRHYVLDVFENEGVDLSRVYLSHCVPYVDLMDDYITLAQRGCFLSFDMTGIEVVVYFEKELKLPESLYALIEAGYLDQILISQDVCFTSCYVKNGGYGYAHILNNIVPKLKAKGITDEQIHTIMVDNPKRVFPFKSYTNTGQCVNSIYTASTGTISDNSGSSDYLNDLDCSKLIQPLNCSSVNLTFTEFNTESANDFLTIYDGPTTSSPILGQYSGSTLPPVLESTFGSILLVFNTNGSVTKSGWKANYYGKINTDYSGPCVNEVFSAESGTIADNSGSSDYSDYLSCQKLIEVPGSKAITLQFTSFETEDGFDFVKVYDGSSISSPLLGAFSGNALPPLLNSTGGSMLILFTTNGEIQASGWSANYSSNILNVKPKSISVSSAPGTTSFTISSNIDWSLSESSDWLTAIKTNDTTLTVSYDENISLDERLAEVTVSGTDVISQSIFLYQSGISRTLGVTPDSRSVGYTSGTTTFTVTSNIDWSLSESSGWLTATKSDDTTLTVIYDENTIVDARSAEITVSGQGVTSQNILIIQSGANPTLSVAPDSRSVNSDSGTITFTVSSNIDWTLSESSGWLTALKTDDTTLTVSYDENTIVDARSAEIAVSGLGVVSQFIYVNQSGVSPALSVTPESRTVSPSSGTTTFTVSSNIDWTLSESSGWLTATKTDDTTLTVSYDENTIVDARSAEIALSGPGVTSQNILINQNGVTPTLSVTPESRSVGSSSGTTTFTVTSNIDWSLSENSIWFTAIKADATNLTVNYDENTSVVSRFEKITIGGAGVNSQSVYIIQEGDILSTIKPISEIQQINIFPNPVSNKISITYPEGKSLIIEIYEPSGRLVIRLQSSYKNEVTEIDFSGFNSGLYLYRIIDKEGNFYNGKILKE
jgi:phosphotriesterase-related protein